MEYFKQCCTVKLNTKKKKSNCGVIPILRYGMGIALIILSLYDMSGNICCDVNIDYKQSTTHRSIFIVKTYLEECTRQEK